MSISRNARLVKGWVQIVRTLPIPIESEPQELTCANTERLNRELSENIGRLKTHRPDDRPCCTNLGKVLKGGGQFVPPLLVSLQGKERVDHAQEE